jgi:succinyl-CoA synthetase beta subunit/citryl-CoA synthetase large subunit
VKLLEFEAKALLRDLGLKVPAGEAAATPEAAAAAAERLDCPVAVKAQVPASGRMKAGGVLFAESPAQAARAAADLLGRPIRGHAVESVLVEAKLAIAAEIYAGVTYDAARRTAVLLGSRAGGIEVETHARLARCEFSSLGPVPEYVGREVARQLGFEGSRLMTLGSLLARLANCFLDWDALLVEVNPLALDAAGEWWAADAHVELDEDAAFRQQALWARVPASRRLSSRRSQFEERAAEIDRADHRGVAGRLIAFDGDLGLLIGGGGASLAIFDAVLEAGLRPANYCEIGGNPSVWKVKELVKLILSQPAVKRLAVMMNVVSNTRADLMARGVIKGVLELGRDPRDVIIAFRVPGSWEDEGQAILRHYGVPFFGRETSMDAVVGSIRWPS